MIKSFYKFYVLKDKNLVIEILRDRFDICDFVNLKILESEDPDFDPNFDTILDIRDVENAFSENIRNDLENFLKLIKALQCITKKRKAAVITRKPSQVAGISWYKSIDDRGIDYRIFSTLKAATEWLGISEIKLESIDLCLSDK